MFSSNRSEPTSTSSSSLSLANAIDEIRQSTTIPFNVDELLNTHGISLSSRAQGIAFKSMTMVSLTDSWIEHWSTPRQQENNTTTKETLQRLKEATTTTTPSGEQYEETRVWVDEYLTSVQSLGTWVDEASDQISKVEKTRDTLNDMITRIETQIPTWIKWFAHATINLFEFMGEWQTMKRLYRKGTLYTFNLLLLPTRYHAWSCPNR